MSELRMYRKLNGKCEQCGAELDRVGICCIRCNSRLNELKVGYAEKLRKKGMCTQCSKPLDRKGNYCQMCLNKTNNKMAELNKFRRENGICVRCGNDSLPYRYCQRCRDLRMNVYYSKKGER